MKKITIGLNKEVSRTFSGNVKLLTHKDGWVTWFKQEGKRVDIFTCREEDFECQNDTQEITLWLSEIKELAKLK